MFKFSLNGPIYVLVSTRLFFYIKDDLKLADQNFLKHKSFKNIFFFSKSIVLMVLF